MKKQIKFAMKWSWFIFKTALILFSPGIVFGLLIAFFLSLGLVTLAFITFLVGAIVWIGFIVGWMEYDDGE